MWLSTDFYKHCTVEGISQPDLLEFKSKCGVTHLEKELNDWREDAALVGTPQEDFASGSAAIASEASVIIWVDHPVENDYKIEAVVDGIFRETSAVQHILSLVQRLVAPSDFDNRCDCSLVGDNEELILRVEAHVEGTKTAIEIAGNPVRAPLDRERFSYDINNFQRRYAWKHILNIKEW